MCGRSASREGRRNGVLCVTPRSTNPPPTLTLCTTISLPFQVRAQLAAVWRTCWPLPELKTFWWWCPDGENVAGLYVHYCSPLWWKTLAGAWHGRRDRVLRFDALCCTGNRKGWCVVDPATRERNANVPSTQGGSAVVFFLCGHAASKARRSYTSTEYTSYNKRHGEIAVASRGAPATTWIAAHLRRR